MSSKPSLCDESQARARRARRGCGQGYDRASGEDEVRGVGMGVGSVAVAYSRQDASIGSFCVLRPWVRVGLRRAWSRVCVFTIYYLLFTIFEVTYFLCKCLCHPHITLQSGQRIKLRRPYTPHTHTTTHLDHTVYLFFYVSPFPTTPISPRVHPCCVAARPCM